MSDLTYLHFPDTQQTFLFSSLDLDPTVKAAAAALPDSTISIPGSAPVPVAAKMIIAGKALDIPGIYRVGAAVSGGSGGPVPGPAQGIVAQLTPAGDIVVTCSPPVNAGTIQPWLYVFQLAGVGAAEPVSSTDTSITFLAPGAGTWTPTVWVVSATGVSAPATGAPITIGAPSTTAHVITDSSGGFTLDLLADHTYQITPTAVTGSPVARLLDQSGADLGDFDGSTALSISIPTGTTRVSVTYWSDLPGSITFEVTEAGSSAPVSVATHAVVGGSLTVGEYATVVKAIYSDGTTGDYGIWTVLDLPEVGLELNVGTSDSLLLLPEWAGHLLQWTQFWSIGNGLGAQVITVGPIVSSGTTQSSDTGLYLDNGQGLYLDSGAGLFLES